MTFFDVARRAIPWLREQWFAYQTGRMVVAALRRPSKYGNEYRLSAPAPWPANPTLGAMRRIVSDADIRQILHAEGPLDG